MTGGRQHIQRGYAGQGNDLHPAWVRAGWFKILPRESMLHNLKLINCPFMEFFI